MQDAHDFLNSDLTEGDTDLNTWGIHFWRRKVFEGVQKHVLNLLRKLTFGAEKCLKEFRNTCLICFADTILQSITSIMHRKCIIGTFKTHQNWKLTRDYLIFSSTLQFWCIFLSEINYHVSSCNFGCIIDIMLCTKIVSAEQIKHVLLNFFKHFSALRMIPPRSVVPGHYRDILEQKSQNL